MAFWSQPTTPASTYVATSAELIALVVYATTNRVCGVTGRREARVGDPRMTVCSTCAELTTATAAPTSLIRSNPTWTARSKAAQSTGRSRGLAAAADAANGAAPARAAHAVRPPRRSDVKVRTDSIPAQRHSSSRTPWPSVQPAASSRQQPPNR
jgi:hypothetical protein